MILLSVLEGLHPIALGIRNGIQGILAVLSKHTVLIYTIQFHSCWPISRFQIANVVVDFTVNLIGLAEYTQKFISANKI